MHQHTDHGTEGVEANKAACKQNIRGLQSLCCLSKRKPLHSLCCLSKRIKTYEVKSKASLLSLSLAGLHVGLAVLGPNRDQIICLRDIIKTHQTQNVDLGHLVSHCQAVRRAEISDICLHVPYYWHALARRLS